jgi:hypothetical protein
VTRSGEFIDEYDIVPSSLKLMEDRDGFVAEGAYLEAMVQCQYGNTSYQGDLT